MRKHESLVEFTRWLEDRGAQILKPTNQYELLRFDTERGVGIVYTNAKGTRTFTGEADPAYKAYVQVTTWTAGGATRRKKTKQDNIVLTLLGRDGTECFYCRLPVGASPSIEHLVPVSHGGPNHLSNYVLAHVACNRRAGHLPAMLKIRMREQLHEHVRDVLDQQNEEMVIWDGHSETTTDGTSDMECPPTATIPAAMPRSTVG